MPATLSRESADTLVRESLQGFASADELAALDDQETLRRALELDSIDFQTFIERLSAATGIRIEEQDYDRLGTIGSCVDFLTEAS